jgi:phytoene dehydrogenase-like protein
MNDTAARGKAASATGAAPGASFDAVVIGGDVDGLAAAAKLGASGSKVLLIEEGPQIGGTLREIEFAPGYRVAPLAPPRDPGVLALGDGAPLEISLASDSASVARSAESLRSVSATDSARWSDFLARMGACAGFLAELYQSPAPRIDAATPGEFLTLANLALRFRKLGRRGMADLLRVLPIPVADLLDDELETPCVKGALAALAVSDLAQGPAAAGTGFTFLHRQVVLSRAMKESGDLIAAYEQRARSAGVMIRTGTKVAEISVRDGRATGVVLGGGEEIGCGTVISSLDPYRSLIELIDPRHHDPEFIHAVRNIRFRGVATRVLLALEAPPAIPGTRTSQHGFAGSIVIAPTVRFVERAYEATKYGRVSDQPFIEARFPSPRVAVLHVQYTPYRLRDGGAIDGNDIADRAIAALAARLPGFASRVRDRKVLGPRDLEAEFGLREGAPSRGELTLDQILFMRPVPDASRYATPIEGYYVCGAGTHPGAGIFGVSGVLAAKASRAARVAPRVAAR